MRLPLCFLALLFSMIMGKSAMFAQTAPIAPNTITAEIDTAVLTMGERTNLRVEVIKNGHVGSVLIPFEKNADSDRGPSSLAGIEIRKIEVDSTDLGNNRVQIKYNLLLQPFEPKDYVIPPFMYAEGKDTLKSKVVALKVLEPEIPQEMRDSLYINPLRPPMSIKAEWYDWVPDFFTTYWYIWLIALIVITAAVILAILYKKNGKSLLPRRRVIPPYELATRRLQELKNKRLAEKGQDKAYYTELTDILRQYLGGRFKIYALEMTSSQILQELKDNPETAPFAAELKPMFTIADFVKFAKQTSTPTENVKSFNSVEKFVNETKPVETPDAKKE